MPQTPDTIYELYKDTKTCAKLIGLSYIEDDSVGYTRKKSGKGFSYTDLKNHKLVDATMKQWITELVIPPAWQEVWICPSQDGHVLSTGIDERGRKQYIYHRKWRSMRDLIKFYRMIVFGAALPAIRRDIDKHLTGKLDFPGVLAVMLWILDNTYIRIGNDKYFNENESVGLTTLTDKNVVVAGPIVTLSFKGKSGKDQQISFENEKVAAVIKELAAVRGARLFRYKDSHGWHDIEASDINSYLHDITETTVSAKDFRTWGGTLMAFDSLITEDQKKDSLKPEKAVLAAVDQAAAILGNTRSVARESYVHPDLLKTYGHKNFAKYYKKAHAKQRVTGLSKRESDQLHFLGVLFEEEFDLLKR